MDRLPRPLRFLIALIGIASCAHYLSHDLTITVIVTAISLALGIARRYLWPLPAETPPERRKPPLGRDFRDKLRD